MGRLRQGGGGFNCQILVRVRRLPTSQACVLANPSHLSAPTRPNPAPNSVLKVLFTAPGAQLPAQLLIDCLSGCLLFLVGHWSMCDCGRWPDGGGAAEDKPQKSGQRMRGAEGQG